MDVLTPEQRHRNMSRIRGRDTKPEMLVRRGLHRQGLRFRLHVKALPGCPDLVFSGRKVVIFINGCFWHGHGCHLCKVPKTRTEFWTAKIAANVARDIDSVLKLRELGWRVLTVWECALRGALRMTEPELLSRAAAFVADENAKGSTELPPMR